MVASRLREASLYSNSCSEVSEPEPLLYGALLKKRQLDCVNEPSSSRGPRTQLLTEPHAVRNPVGPAASSTLPKAPSTSTPQPNVLLFGNALDSAGNTGNVAEFLAVTTFTSSPFCQQWIRSTETLAPSLHSKRVLAVTSLASSSGAVKVRGVGMLSAVTTPRDGLTPAVDHRARDREVGVAARTPRGASGLRSARSAGANGYAAVAAGTRGQGRGRVALHLPTCANRAGVRDETQPQNASAHSV